METIALFEIPAIKSTSTLCHHQKQGSHYYLTVMKAQNPQKVVVVN